MARRMPARTAKGTAMLRRIRGFRRVIATAETHMSRWAEEENVFTRYLPYAIVFGLTEKWAKAFEDLGIATRHVELVRGAARVHRDGVRGLDRRIRGDHRGNPRVHARVVGLERFRRRRVLGRRRRRRGRRLLVTGLKVVFSEDPRDFQRRDWSDLVRADPAGTIFHTPDFLKLYWEEFGEEPEHLLLAFGEEDNGAQVAAAAFELIGDTLRFLGGTEVTDYMGPVGRPGGGVVRERLWVGVLDTGDWQVADLRGLPEDSSWLPALREAALGHGLSVEETEDQNGVAPLLDLPSTWDDYLLQLPSKLRHEIRRKAKKLEAEAGPFRIETATAATLLPLLDRFVELHRMSEGPKGVFMVPGMEIFFRRLGRPSASAASSA